MEYDILVMSNRLNLINAIKEKMKEGWKAKGGIAIDCTGVTTYCQAIVKKSKNL